ncbi:MAG: hydrogenase accessory protein HypB [Candidatus Aminicenantes bacterium RBG_13_62_12]|nr:MAG: hydrogenase accessory protein HypB [Candidatus Aminicenantes bacterium RBG_13_62_12]
MKRKDVAVYEDILKSNVAAAAEVRRRMRERGVLTVNLMSSPGAGKTTLLERLVEKLSPPHRLAVIEGDIETERDAERIRAKGVPAWQIRTGGACHLEAKMVGRLLDELPGDLDFLFIENVGNLVCPAAFDLGESLRVVLLSAPEGDDKPKKYPKAFFTAQALVLSKADLMGLLPFDPERARREALEVNPALEVFRVSALTGEGLDEFVAYLHRARAGLAAEAGRHA